MTRLAGKVAIVTGAGAGQGAEEARLLCALGAKVAASDVNAQAVQDVVAAINDEAPGRAIALQHDVASSDDWRRVVAETIKAFGPINVLVNNAGTLSRTPFEEITLAQWQAVMNVNAWGAFAGMQAVAPVMREAGGGSIVNIASTAARTAVGGLSAYTASKGAIDAMTRAAAVELGAANIRVNCVHPGIIQTAMVSSLSTKEALAAAASAVPLQRVGQPADIAYVVAYLASDEAWFTTGASVTVDGGATIEGGIGLLKERVAATR